MASSVENAAPRAACPRCGYDLRGTIETWNDACPLQGTCTECGLDLAWSELLAPEAHMPRWSFEYAPRRRLPPWPPLRRTAIRCLWPPWFWSSLKMSHEVRRGRVAALLAVIVLGLGLCYVLEQATVATRVHFDVNRNAARSVPSAAQLAQMITAQQTFIQAIEQRFGPEAAGEIYRVQMARRELAVLQYLRANPGRPVRHPLVVAILEAVFTPTASSTRGTIATPRGFTTYPVPRTLHGCIGAGQWRRQTSAWFAPDALLVLASIASAAGLTVLMPLSFVLVPVSRRQAKVRWIHVARVTVYGLVVPALLLGGAAVISAATAAVGAASLPASVGLALIIAPVPFVLAWWTVAIRRYLRMPHASSLVALLASMNLLLVTLVGLSVEPHLGTYLFFRSILY